MLQKIDAHPTWFKGNGTGINPILSKLTCSSPSQLVIWKGGEV